MGIRIVSLTNAGWAVAAQPGAAPLAVHAAAASAIEQARSDLAATPDGGRIDVYEGGAVTRSIPVTGTSGTGSQKAASTFDMVMPWVVLALPAAITWFFGSSAPELFAPGILEASDSLWGAILATLAWSLGVATFTFVCFKHKFESWITLGLAGIACLAASNFISWLLNLQTFADSPIIPVYAQGSWPQMIFGTIFGLVGLGAVIYGWGGLILGGIAGFIAGWRAADKWDIDL